MQPKTFREKFLDSLEDERFADFHFEEFEDEEAYIYSMMVELETDDVPYLVQFFFFEEDELADLMISKPIKKWDSLTNLRKVNKFNSENRFICMMTHEQMLSVRGHVWKEEGVESLWEMFFYCMEVAENHYCEFESEKNPR